MIHSNCFLCSRPIFAKSIKTAKALVVGFWCGGPDQPESLYVCDKCQHKDEFALWKDLIINSPLIGGSYDFEKSISKEK